ncbi:hypothetical protein ILUMI_15611, partial [Ignelater luminosus]
GKAMSGYKRKMDRKLIFTQEILEEIRRKVSIGVSKRSIAKEMNINESTLRKRLKVESVGKSLGRYFNDIPIGTGTSSKTARRQILCIDSTDLRKLQSLDIAFFGPLKCAYSHECNKWIINNPGKVITQLQVGKLFSAVYIAIANIEKALDSFKASGIYPFNPDKFQDVNFAPSLVTDMPRSIDKETETAEETTHPENAEVEQAAVEVHSVIEKSNIEGVKDHCPDILNLEVECKDGMVIPSIEDTPHNMSCQNRPRGKSRAQKSEILSSSPLKNKLEELEDTKRMKPVKK